jgi:hypothetical protein
MTTKDKMPTNPQTPSNTEVDALIAARDLTPRELLAEQARAQAARKERTESLTRELKLETPKAGK